MKSLIPLIALAFTVASSNPLLADKPAKDKETPADTEPNVPPGLKKKGGVPPGLQKKGGLPPGQAKKRGHDQPPADLFITNAPMTNVVARPVPTRPIEPPGRIESPRSQETTKPVPPVTTTSTSEPATAPAPAQPPQPSPAPVATPVPGTQPATPATTKSPAPSAPAKTERDLDAQLMRVHFAWMNPKTRKAALDRIAAETGVPAASVEAQYQANQRLRGGDLLMANKIATLSKQSAGEVMTAYQKKGQWLSTGEAFGVPADVLIESARRVGAGR